MVHAHTTDTDTAAPIKKVKTNNKQQSIKHLNATATDTVEQKHRGKNYMKKSSCNAQKAYTRNADRNAVIEEKKIFFSTTNCTRVKLKPTLLTLITMEYSFPSCVLDDPNKCFLLSILLRCFPIFFCFFFFTLLSIVNCKWHTFTSSNKVECITWKC